MKKTNALWRILDIIFPVVFNVVFFLAGGFEHKASVWISWGFIHFAYVMLVLTPYLLRRGISTVVFGFSLYSVSATYFFLEFILGLVFIAISSDSYKAALIIQLVIAGLYSLSLVSNMIANEVTADAEEKRQYHIDYIKTASSNLKGLLERITDKETKKKVEKIYDALNSSPVKSHQALVNTESQILMSTDDLASAISSENKDKIISLADSLLITINERNRQLKMFN